MLRSAAAVISAALLLAGCTTSQQQSESTATTTTTSQPAPATCETMPVESLIIIGHLDFGTGAANLTPSENLFTVEQAERGTYGLWSKTDPDFVFAIKPSGDRTFTIAYNWSKGEVCVQGPGDDKLRAITSGKTTGKYPGSTAWKNNGRITFYKMA